MAEKNKLEEDNLSRIKENMADSLDKIMYSFVVEDVLKGFFITVPPGYVACVYDLGRGVLKKVLHPGLHLKIPFWQRAKLFNTQDIISLQRNQIEVAIKNELDRIFHPRGIHVENVLLCEITSQFKKNE